ncbi:polysaccharide deacetylase family protein [Paenibacillaceae bacterium WGS1546]|uniref:polysaccharide deacetylase family protein n=1 Tax=Cohnella sp. WGS1546 TaxID=3366810 RepID=UPI00372D741C
MKRSTLRRQARFPQRRVALTFDDGPNPVYTPQILAVLERVSGKATFFMIGEQMERYPDVVRQVAEAGHEIGNHTFSHPRLTGISRAECRSEIRRAELLIRKLTGRAPTALRPPYLDIDDTVARIAASAGYTIVGASNLEARDWEQPGVRHIYERSLECVANGSVLLFHDGYGDRSQTVEAVGLLADKLSGQGYKLVTASELLADE